MPNAIGVDEDSSQLDSDVDNVQVVDMLEVFLNGFCGHLWCWKKNDQVSAGLVYLDLTCKMSRDE